MDPCRSHTRLAPVPLLPAPETRDTVAARLRPKPVPAPSDPPARAPARSVRARPPRGAVAWLVVMVAVSAAFGYVVASLIGA